MVKRIEIPPCGKYTVRRRRKNREELQAIITSKEYLIRLISSNGTQQDDENDVICLGCNRPFTYTGNILYRGKKDTKYPGCRDCQRVERASAQQERLDRMGKRVDIITSLYQGVGEKHENWVRCRDCGATFPVSGRKLSRPGNPTPGCDEPDGCTTARKKKLAKDSLAQYREGPGYGVEEAQRKFESLGKPGKGTILEWNGTRIGPKGKTKPAPARFLCECEEAFDTTGETIMNPKCTYNGCPSCGPEATRQANLKYDLQSVKDAINRNQKRKLDLDRILSFGTVHDRVTVLCEKHQILCEDKHIWALMRGSSPCPQCRAEKIGETQSAGWIETEREMRKVEAAHIQYFSSTYTSRSKKMRKRCSKIGHNTETKGIFYQEPKLTIHQGSSCPDCGTEKTAAKRRLPIDILLTQFLDEHGDFYEYPDVGEHYVNDSTPIPIVCPIDGEFPQAPGMHKIGQGCPDCAGRGMRSKFEVKLMFEVGKFFPEWEPGNTVVPGIVGGRIGPVDGILSISNKVILEYDCAWWHRDGARVKGDEKKTSILVNKDNGWKVYRVRTGNIPDIPLANNIRLPERENLKQYANVILKQMLDDGILTETRKIERYLLDDKPWLEGEARDWYYSNCRKPPSN